MNSTDLYKILSIFGYVVAIALVVGFIGIFAFLFLFCQGC